MGAFLFCFGYQIFRKSIFALTFLLLARAFRSLVLAEGEYVVIARHESKVFQSTFQVQTGMDRDVEVVAEESGKQGP